MGHPKKVLFLMFCACGGAGVDTSHGSVRRGGGGSEVDMDGDGVSASSDCDDQNSSVGRLLYQNTFDENDGYLETGPRLSDPWLQESGRALNVKGGQQALLGQPEAFTDVVAYARLRGEGLERKCLDCGYMAITPRQGEYAHAFVLPGLFDGEASHVVRAKLRDGAAFRIERDASGTPVSATLRGQAEIVDLGGGPGRVGQSWSVSFDWVYRGRGTAGQGTSGPRIGFPEWQTAEVTDRYEYFDLVRSEFRGAEATVVSFVEHPTHHEYPLQVGFKANNMTVHFGAMTGIAFRHTTPRGTFMGEGSMHLDLVERDRYRAGIVLRANEAASQDEGFTGYRCAVARNSQIDCTEPGDFVQLSSFLEGEEDDIQSECEGERGTCPENPTFRQLRRVDHARDTDVLRGGAADLTFWAVGENLVCEMAGENGEVVSARASDGDFPAGGVGLSVLNLLTAFEEIKVCEAFAVPNPGDRNE